MEPVPPPSPPRFGARGQRLKTSAELRASRSVGSKKRLARRWTNWGAPVPPSLTPYAYDGASSSGAGSSSSSSRRRRTPSPPPSLSSGFSSEESEEEDGDRVVEGDFVASNEAEARVLARMKRRSERARFREVAADDAELEEALRLIERQKAEEEAVQQLQQRQKAEERAADVIVID